MSHERNGIVERRLLNQLLNLLKHGRHPVLTLLLGWGDEDGVLFNVAVVTVVSRVSDLPREVRHHKQGVNRPANSVVQHRVCRESAMATLMTDNPDSNADAALEKSVGNPGTDPLCGGRQEIDMKSCIYEHSRVNEVAGKVGEGLDRRAFKAVRWNLAPQESIGDLFGLWQKSA